MLLDEGLMIIKSEIYIVNHDKIRRKPLRCINCADEDLPLLVTG